MAIPTTVSTAVRILAIDLGKYKSVECRYDASSGEVALASFDTTRSELVKRLVRHRPDVVVIEACALSGWVHDLCVGLRIPCRSANTASEAWKFKHSKRKTGRNAAVPVPSIAATPAAGHSASTWTKVSSTASTNRADAKATSSTCGPKCAACHSAPPRSTWCTPSIWNRRRAAELRRGTVKNG